MTRFMRAAVVRSFREPLVIEEVPVPSPGRGQVLIRVESSGVCHTDLHAADGDWPVRPTPPFIPGHEGAGQVSALGPDVVGLSVGDRVGVAWLHSACSACEYCLTGWETLCRAQQNTGYSVNGAFAEYVVAPAAFVGRIPDELSLDAAAPILCAGVTTYKGLKETDTRPGQWVVVSGIGGLGHVAVQYARAMGPGSSRRRSRSDRRPTTSPTVSPGSARRSWRSSPTPRSWSRRPVSASATTSSWSGSAFTSTGARSTA
jgi:alcohol dehydrogenase, propanol-preferring